MISKYRTGGWFKEPRRHSLARQGIKTGRKVNYQKIGDWVRMLDMDKKGRVIDTDGRTVTIKMRDGSIHTVDKSETDYAREVREIKKATTYTDDEFEYVFSPIEDTIAVEKRPDGYIVKYLTQDNDAESPDAWGDDSMFLVHYHRDFDIRNKNIITEDDARDFYQGNKIEQEKNYWIFPVEAYIHSGVALAFQSEGNFPDRRWDVSHVGLILVSKKEFKSKEKAKKSASGLLESWNQYLSGDVYSVVAEKYDKEKVQIDHDVVSGYYGLDDAKEELKSFDYTERIVKGQKKVSDYAKNSYFTKKNYFKQYEKIMSSPLSTYEKKMAVDRMTDAFKKKGIKL